MHRHPAQGIVIPHEQPCHRSGQSLGHAHHGKAAHAHQQNTFPQQVLQLAPVARAEMIADDGRAADGIADEHGGEDELHVHQHAESRHAVLPRQPQQLEVIQHAHHRGGHVADQLRRAVAAGLQDRPQLQLCLCQLQQAAVGPQEVHQRQHAAHDLADAGGDGSARHAPVEHRHEQGVQRHVGNARRHRDPQAQLGLFRRDQEALEHVLQHIRRVEGQHDAAIQHAIRQHFCVRTQKDGDRLHKDHAQRGDDDAADEGGGDHHGEVLIGAVLVALAHGFGHQCAAAGAEHEADAAKDHDEGHHQIHGGEGGLAHEIGHKQPVHHAVDGGEHHHDDGRQHELQEHFIGKVIG